MKNFENIEDLITYMFENLDGDPVSVVADKDLAVAIMKELLDYDNVILSFVNVDTYSYDKEYIVSLYDDVDTDYWYVSIEKTYDHESNRYFGTDGYILFHEDVNSKALLDIQNNEFILLGGYDWFVIGEDEETADETEAETESDNDVLTVNGKKVGTDEYNAFVSKFAPDKMIKTDDKPASACKETYKINGRVATKEEYKKALSNIEDMYMDNIRDMLLNYCEIMDEMNEWRKIFRW